MTKKLQSITNRMSSYVAIVGILILWQVLSSMEIIPKFMLPSPLDVVEAFILDFPLLMNHAKTTLLEAFFGLAIGISLGFMVAIIMDRFNFIYKAVYPILVITQTIPTVAIAPLLVLWLGYGMAPKITLIVIVTFFPITISLLDGFKSVDSDAIQLLRSMNASDMQIFKHIKLPSSIPHFFAGLRISVSYSVVGAVISEWLGGFNGLGVYMTRVKKSYSFDKMFAVILLISVISLALMKGVSLLEKISMPWARSENE
ncbi:ABC transporter permease [Tepidimicrobium xylanilyticum]|uniref:ABC-type nitrate/sulfonate/bicarbonate transport system, permease component n=1 Tax=Tepidimicrobium xylanilyticum TaxID=1123352 RepID=A0A1H2WS19_9FIRM|nr:ABC transporter permease [Tepidimicrobium xylanilyticum]SDW83430.1 ABC-type nitrate/sulfonate/bicarbonate transport system, permease component [Tepidimicrobium xylanilyticum]